MKYIIVSIVVLFVGAPLSAMDNPDASVYFCHPMIDELKQEISLDKQIVSSVKRQDANILKSFMFLYEHPLTDDDYLYEDMAWQGNILMFKLFLAGKGLALSSNSSNDELYDWYREFYRDRIKRNSESLNHLLAQLISNSIDEILDELSSIYKKEEFKIMLGMTMFQHHLVHNCSINCNNGKTRQEINVAIQRKDDLWLGFLSEQFKVFIHHNGRYLKEKEKKMLSNPHDIALRNEVARLWKCFNLDIENTKKANLEF